MSNLSHTFTVDAIAGVVDTDVTLNVLKRREFVSFGSSLPTSAVNIGFISSGGIAAATNISITDLSIPSKYNFNREVDTGYTVIENTNSFTIDTDVFLVTDVFTTATNTVQVLPLMYKHILNDTSLPRDTDGSLDTGYVLQEIKILDQFQQPLGLQEKVVDYDLGIIYLNLLPEYKSTTDYSLYYVEYKIKTPSNSIIVYRDLLSPEPVYSLADFADLDESLQLIDDGRKVYLIDETAGQFSVTLPVNNTYAYQPLSSERLQVVHPVGQDSDDGWFVRVRNTTVYTNINGSVYKYRIGEFLTQLFNPAPPIKLSSLETSTILTTSLLKLDHRNIVQDSYDLLYISILINDASNEGLAALTTDPLLEGTTASNGITYAKWDRVSLLGIKSVDEYTGVVEVDGIDLESNYIIAATYYYSEEYYEYSFMNFNPLFNDEVLNGKTAIFVDPDTISTDKDQTLYFMRMDDAGRVVESNHSDFDNDTLLWDTDQILYYDSLPDFLSDSPLDSSEPYYVASEDYTLFRDELTIDGDTDLVSNPLFMILAEVSVAPSMTVNEITKIDSRRRGGGIIESQYSTVVADEPEAAWVWDEGHWDGVPYPSNASYYVEVPVSVLEEAGGTLKQNEVKQIVERHTAAGVYPVVKAYGVDILVDGIIPEGNSITLRWHSNGYSV